MELGAVDFQEPSLVWYFRSRIKGWMTPLNSASAAQFMDKDGARFVILPTTVVTKVFPNLPATWKSFSTRGFNIERKRCRSYACVEAGLRKALLHMITFLDGKLVSALPTQATVDVNGVGYEVFIPLSSYDKLPTVGQAIRILTHLAVREDAHILYGFMTVPERDLFRLLVNNVSGIGPKLALAVLSGMSVSNFKTAVVNSDIAAISNISGLGKKTAERSVRELKGKSGVAAAREEATAPHTPTPELEQG